MGMSGREEGECKIENEMSIEDKKLMAQCL